MRRGEGDALDGRDGWEDEDGGQAGVAQPFSFAKSDTCSNEDVVEDLSALSVFATRRTRVIGYLRGTDARASAVV